AYVEALHVDQQGRLWIGTFRGLNYYDGSRFHTFAGLYPTANVVSIAEDHDGRLWVAARNDGI
ncbi:MAG: two-component regulator propeller domain-containing protein, partial [Rhodothermales bacterium]